MSRARLQGWQRIRAIRAGGTRNPENLSQAQVARTPITRQPVTGTHLQRLCVLMRAQATVDAEMEDAYEAAEQQRALLTRSSFTDQAGTKPSLLRDMLNISPIMTDAAGAIIDDSFNKCFTCLAPDPWNWNAYLWPQWLMGTILRHCILFPLRLITLLICNIIFMGIFFMVGVIYKPGPTRTKLEIAMIQVRAGQHTAVPYTQLLQPQNHKSL